MSNKLLFLGSGGSLGIPVIGCKCEVCTSNSPFNKRLRPCCLIKINSKNFIIDPGPDYRIQALKFGIDHVDGVLVTHAHHDHTAGLDDMRVYSGNNKRPLSLLLSEDTYADLKKRYAYIFNPESQPKSLVSKFVVTSLAKSHGFVTFVEVPFGYTSYYQTGMKVTGFRVGDLAYFSDIKDFTDEVFEMLNGVNTLIVSALRFTTSPMHFTVDEAINFINKAGVKKGWLTHIAHELDHNKGNAYLPPHIRMAYDGLEITFDI